MIDQETVALASRVTGLIAYFTNSKTLKTSLFCALINSWMARSSLVGKPGSSNCLRSFAREEGADHDARSSSSFLNRSGNQKGGNPSISRHALILVLLFSKYNSSKKGQFELLALELSCENLSFKG